MLIRKELFGKAFSTQPPDSKTLPMAEPPVMRQTPIFNRCVVAAAFAMVDFAFVLPIFAAPPDINAAVWGRWESNVSNSDVAADRLSDGFFGMRVSAGTGGVFGRDWRWRAAAVGEGELAIRFAELGFLEGGVNLGLERKFGLGWQAPRLLADFLSTMRGDGQPGASGVRMAPSIGLLWQGGERWGLRVRYTPEWFLAQSTVFDSFSNAVGIAGWYDLFPSTRLKLGYTFRYGDVVSYAVPPRPDLVANSEARAFTNVFGAERVVYRLEAATHSIEAAVRQDITDDLGLQATYRWEITEGQGLVYENHIIELGIHAGF